MNDMSKGKILPQILNFALFIFIGGLMQNLYLIIDSIILGQYVGKEALASIGIASTVSFVVIGSIIGITQGFSINMAKSFGAGNFVKFRKYAYNSIILCIIVGLSFSMILSLTNGYFLKLMNTPENLFDMTHNFLLVLYLGCIANLFYNLFAGILRSIGNSFAPLIFLGISVVSNASLVYIFVAILKYGIVGSAFATIISQTIAAITCYIFIIIKYPQLRIKKEEKIIEKKLLKNLLLQGIPMGMQFSFTGIGVIVVQSFLNGFSTEHIAGFSVAIRIQNIVLYIYVALGSALATYTSQNFGAKKFTRITKGVNYTALISVAISIFAAFLIITFGEQVANLFTEEKNPELIKATTTYFHTVVWGYPILALLILYRNVLQGYGFAITAMFAGIIELLMRVIVVFLFTGTYGYLAICLADLATWLVTGLSLIFTYYYLKNKKLAIIK
ncbi:MULTISPECIES: MATE family efflux transporter [unclassified Gemella]|uniref:MATE family efflux transporter n=1 Tax=unclassified Gemella TaxID=2624949 RepID=UPI001C04ECFA|nr:MULTISPECIES: MATE family efflux transporter [unclassified Gemella]MBU0278168.1 MATE family efflux transporter [Gemella sp. zg-1178]QWQ38874.1 MATE family efflux transporter [Gemella sp. zg-570]